jgi:hypothetical protein
MPFEGSFSTDLQTDSHDGELPMSTINNKRHLGTSILNTDTKMNVGTNLASNILNTDTELNVASGDEKMKSRHQS